MLLLGEIIIGNPEIDDFESLVKVVKAISRTSNERFFRMDVKPDYADTPDNWEDRLEASFY